MTELLRNGLGHGSLRHREGGQAGKCVRTAPVEMGVDNCFDTLSERVCFVQSGSR